MRVDGSTRNLGTRESSRTECFSLMGTLQGYEVEEISAHQAARLFGEMRRGSQAQSPKGVMGAGTN